MDNKLLLTVEETRKILGMGRNSMYDLVKQKDFPSMSVGNKTYINKEKLQSWINKKCEK